MVNDLTLMHKAFPMPRTDSRKNIESRDQNIIDPYSHGAFGLTRDVNELDPKSMQETQEYERNTPMKEGQ